MCVCVLGQPSPPLRAPLTDVLGVNRHQHVDQPLRQQQAEAQQHESLQHHGASGPDVGQQQPELPAEASPR